MPKEETLRFKLASGETLKVTIRRSNRARRLRLTLGASGETALVAPVNMPYEDIAGIAPEFLPWLEKNWARRQILPDMMEFPAFVEIPLLGKKFLTAKNASIAAGRRHVNDKSLLYSCGARRVLINLEQDSLIFYGHVDEDLFLIRALRAFVRRLAEIHLQGHFFQLARLGAYEDVKLVVRNQRSRWGSCSKKAGREKATISLNWRALLLSRELLDHLCWHELAHLREMNHSPAFHAELAMHSPDWRQKERELGRALSYLPIWARPD